MATPLQENQGAPPSRGAMQVRELQLQGSSRPKAKPRSANRNTPAEFAVCSSTASYVGAGLFRDFACDQRIRASGFEILQEGISPDLQTRKACGARGMLFHRELCWLLFRDLRDRRRSPDLQQEKACSAGSPRAPQAQPPRMLTARAATISTVTAAISDSMPMNSLARCDNGIASVGLNAIEFVTARYR